MFTHCDYANFRYWDCKIYAFNDMIFNLGWKHARYALTWALVFFLLQFLMPANFT
jgi:hypothetical protein